MLAITLRVFKDLFKSVKSILLIIFILAVTLTVAFILNKYNVKNETIGIGNDIYATGLMVLIYLFSPFFVSSLSHDIVNREIDSKTIRFLATKTSRENIILGKFFGIFLFWCVCIFITVLTIVPFSRSFQISSFLESILFVTYFIGFTLFLSTLIQKTTTSMFVGIISSFSFTIVGIWSIFSENVILKSISYLTPYSYVYKGEFLFMIPLLSLVFVLGSIILIRKKDL